MCLREMKRVIFPKRQFAAALMEACLSTVQKCKWEQMERCTEGGGG